MRREEFRFAHPLRVRWAEVDRQDVVFNAHYFTYFDVAVTEYWRAVGFGYPQELAAEGTDIFAVKATAEFHLSATFDDALEVCVRAARLGRTSMHMALGIYRGGELLTAGELVYVNARIADRVPTAWPERLREALAGYETTPIVSKG